METRRSGLCYWINQYAVPICWGTQLNGNCVIQDLNSHNHSRPYLLGNTVEWKPNDCMDMVKPAVCPYLLGNTVEWKRHEEWN